MNSRVSQLTSELRMIAYFVEYVLWAGTEPSAWHGSSHLTFMTTLWHTIIVSTIQRGEFFGFQFLLLFSVAQFCPTLCDPVYCSTLGFPVLHSLPVCSNSCPLNWRCHPNISSSVSPFSCPQSFPASRSFPVSRLFISGGQTIGASASVLPVNI